MLEREDLPPSEQPAAVIYHAVVYRTEHIHIYLRQIYILEPLHPLIRLVKEHSLPRGYDLAAGAIGFLPLFVTKMVRVTYLGVVVHILCTKLYLGVASREVVIQRDVKRLIPERACSCNMMGNFFRVTAPFLSSLDCVSYFPIKRGTHSLGSVNKILDTAQIFLDVYSDKRNFYIRPEKVRDRSTDTMFLPHTYHRGCLNSYTVIIRCSFAMSL